MECKHEWELYYLGGNDYLASDGYVCRKCGARGQEVLKWSSALQLEIYAIKEVSNE